MTGISLLAQTIKSLPAMQETWVQSLAWEDLLEKGMAAHSSILAWRIPWTEEPGGLQSMGSQRVGHSLVTKPPPPPPLYDCWITVCIHEANSCIDLALSSGNDPSLTHHLHSFYAVNVIPSPTSVS